MALNVRHDRPVDAAFPQTRASAWHPLWRGLRIVILALLALVGSWIGSMGVFPAWAEPQTPVTLDRPALAASPWIQDTNGTYTLHTPSWQLTVDPQRGGRVTGFRYTGSLAQGVSTTTPNILIEDQLEPETYGSTFWLSPQSLWDWPPPAALDRKAYGVHVAQDSLILTSVPSPRLGVQVIKTLSPQKHQSGLDLCYRIQNISDRPQTYAPWEVSRTPAQGITLFSPGEPLAIASPFATPLLVSASGLSAWLHQQFAPNTNEATPISSNNPPEPDRDTKLFADASQGWLAQVIHNLLWLKTFPNLPPQHMAPGEAEIEVYVTASRRYQEIELQGPYLTLEPGEHYTWCVQWYLEPLPAGLDPWDVGGDRPSPHLMAWVQEQAHARLNSSP